MTSNVADQPNSKKMRPTVTKGKKIDLVSSRQNSSLSSSNIIHSDKGGNVIAKINSARKVPVNKMDKLNSGLSTNQMQTMIKQQVQMNKEAEFNLDQINEGITLRLNPAVRSTTHHHSNFSKASFQSPMKKRAT